MRTIHIDRSSESFCGAKLNFIFSKSNKTHVSKQSEVGDLNSYYSIIQSLKILWQTLRMFVGAGEAWNNLYADIISRR